MCRNFSCICLEWSCALFCIAILESSFVRLSPLPDTSTVVVKEKKKKKSEKGKNLFPKTLPAGGGLGRSHLFFLGGDDRRWFALLRSYVVYDRFVFSSYVHLHWHLTVFWRSIQMRKYPKYHTYHGNVSRKSLVSFECLSCKCSSSLSCLNIQNIFREHDLFIINVGVKNSVFLRILEAVSMFNRLDLECYEVLR